MGTDTMMRLWGREDVVFAGGYTLQGGAAPYGARHVSRRNKLIVSSYREATASYCAKLNLSAGRGPPDARSVGWTAPQRAAPPRPLGLRPQPDLGVGGASGSPVATRAGRYREDGGSSQ